MEAWDDSIRKWYSDLIARSFGVPADKLDAYKPGGDIEWPINWDEQRLIEWAKQLAFFAFGQDLDFVNMQVGLVKGDYPFHQVQQTQDFDWDKGPDVVVYVNVDTITMQLWHDVYNEEIVMLGYSKLANKLLLGPIKPIPKLEWIE